MPTNNWARAYLFTGNGQGGQELEMSPQQDTLGYQELLIHPVQSLQLNPARYYDNKLILFDAMPSGPPLPYKGYNWHYPPTTPIAAFGDFQGNFVMVHNRKQDGSGPMNLNISSSTWGAPGGTGFGRATSALLVRTRRVPEFRWWLKRAIPFVWNQIFGMVLSQLKVPWPAKVSADPVEITWIAFPEGASQLQSSKMYIVVHQGLKVDVVLRNVQCSLNAYLEVGIDDHGLFRVTRAKSDYHYYKGFEGHNIEAALSGAMDAWDAVFDIGTGLFNFFADIPAERAYLLPGMQDGTPMEDGILTGNVNRDGVTLVVEPPASAPQLANLEPDHVFDQLGGIVQKFQNLIKKMWGGNTINININNGNGAQVVNQCVNKLTSAYASGFDT